MMRLSSVLLIVFWTINASAQVKKAAGQSVDCATAVAQKVQHLEAQGSHLAVTGLDSTVQRWLSLRAREIEKDVRENGRVMIHKVGDTFQVAGVNARVIAPLGHGYEAEVYLVETPHGLRSAKIFFNERELPYNVNAVKNQSGSVPMPKIEHVDLDAGAILMEYIEGVPVKDIRNHSAEIGLTQKEADEILRAFKKQTKALTRPGAKPSREADVVYSFKTRMFYLIDPF
jgi:hypothetical protein